MSNSAYALKCCVPVHMPGTPTVFHKLPRNSRLDLPFKVMISNNWK